MRRKRYGRNTCETQYLQQRNATPSVRRARALCEPSRPAPAKRARGWDERRWDEMRREEVKEWTKESGHVLASLNESLT
jgi:hypothetical protein